MGPQSDSATRPTVLIIDDDGPYGQNLARDLQDEGFATFAAQTGEEGLQRVAESPPTVVVADLKLGREDVPGFLVVKALRTRFPDIPVIVISGHYLQTPDEVEARALGVADYIFKPFEISELSASIRSALARSPSPLPQRATFYPGITPRGRESRLTACENVFIDIQQRRLERVLRHDFPRTDPHIIADGAARALLEFVRKLQEGIWPRVGLGCHLYQAAWRNVRDGLRWFAKRHITEAKYGARLTIAVEAAIPVSRRLSRRSFEF